MEEQDAVARVREWLRTRPGGDRLRIRDELTTRRPDGWRFTVNAAAYLDGTDVGAGLIPAPVLFVPDDGGEVTLDQASMASTPAEAEWRPDVDPEFDEKAFPELPVRAIRGWTRSTGEYRVNEQYTPGPVWRGFPVPATDAAKLLTYLAVGWISRPEFAQALLDCEVLVPLPDGEPLLRPVPGTGAREVIAYSSSALVPGRYPRRWRVPVRDLPSSAGLTLDPGTGLVRSLTAAELGATGERGPRVEEPAPEAGPAVADALPALVGEFGVEPPDLLERHLRYAVNHARDHHFELTPEECVRYLRGFAWQYRNGVRRRAGQDPEWPADLDAHGLIAHVDEEGRPRPVPWTFGKFSAFGTPAGRFAWHRIVGAYVGFAIGDALGGGADPAGPLPLGGLTRHLLFHTDIVLRGLPPVPTGEVPATLPEPDPVGWLAVATRHAGPPPAEFSALLATALAATPAGAVALADVDGERYAKDVARELTGSGAGAEVTEGVELLIAVFQALLTREAFALPVHVRLREVGGDLATSTLALREDRDADDVAQLESIGDGRSVRSVLGRALFAAAKRGYDPAAAITLAARSGPVAGAIAGALVGARVGLPGLPWVSALPDLGLLEDIASDVFWYFNRNGLQTETAEHPRWERRYPSGRFTPKPKGPDLRSRLRGSLLAGAIGDALGAKTEFDSIDRIREIAGPAGITDFIPAYGGVGRITDDTQMTLFTLEALIRAHAQRRRTGSADVVHSLQLAYQRWLHTQGVAWDRARGPQSALEAPDGWLITHQELFSRRAPGLTCFGELEAYGRSGVRGTVERPINNSKGCGGVMRAAPIAVWSDDLAEVFRLGAESAALTHGHPSGYLSSGCFAVVVHELLHGKPLLDAVATARAELVKHAGHEEQSAALDAALALAEQGPPTPEKLESLGAGNIGETALSMSVYVALTTTDADTALLASVNHSGDSDSTGSVCGNLVGAMYGEGALRQSWLERLELRDVIVGLADDAITEFGPGAPGDDRWFARYPVD
ncbi:ADP-ribosylglycohydrolase family protein [Amycolatopsis sp. FBCC-B4732]|uniref:ADP-ribosylglycohydrolase family protein n=1 Tax=Amycolatopsis sp. FBCC-B4732 TaxID=3079339 RepID=UPI001FF5102B|nr:ADP-ribosylglycohydrolase family protein [Amycolatopsis sp. FBCC-B4732]UOX87249.1 ADP-ribosylglycohydrolase family protein [Amycolatopsis sp. FBCC-B4732]